MTNILLDSTNLFKHGDWHWARGALTHEIEDNFNSNYTRLKSGWTSRGGVGGGGLGGLGFWPFQDFLWNLQDVHRDFIIDCIFLEDKLIFDSLVGLL